MVYIKRQTNTHTILFQFHLCKSQYLLVSIKELFEIYVVSCFVFGYHIIEKNMKMVISYHYIVFKDLIDW